jgi:dTDP-4-dehydrorhamnose 3,5-epimerase
VKFHRTALDGAWLIEPELLSDVRGSFARTFCIDEFKERGLDVAVAQCSLSRNRLVGTLRGLHFQRSPLEEVKLVRVQRGAIWDVIVDLRKGSPTFRSWYSTILTADNACAVYVPKGFAHGFMTLTEDAEVFYQMSACHVPKMAWGVRWDDPDIAIEWPAEPTVISERDRALPLLTEAMTALNS